MGHRGRKEDPLYRCRRLLTKAEERLGEAGKEKLLGLLRAGDPRGDVATMWEAKEAVRELYTHGDPALALEWVEQLGADLQDADYPSEARSLGRTLIRWKHQIAAWHKAQVSNGPTEAVNNLIKRVKRAAFGFTSFRNYRIRSLLCALPTQRCGCVRLRMPCAHELRWHPVAAKRTVPMHLALANNELLDRRRKSETRPRPHRWRGQFRQRLMCPSCTPASFAEKPALAEMRSILASPRRI